MRYKFSTIDIARNKLITGSNAAIFSHEMYDVVQQIYEVEASRDYIKVVKRVTEMRG